MKWFGESWGAPVCRPAARIEVPVGQSCQYCGELIADTDQGFAVPPVPMHFHLDCFTRTTIGSIGCQAGLCGNPQCYPASSLRVFVTGRSLKDPPGLTPREAAKAAAEFAEAPPSPAIRAAILTRWLAISAARQTPNK